MQESRRTRQRAAHLHQTFSVVLWKLPHLTHHNGWKRVGKILSGWVVAVWHRSAVNVSATFCFVGFVFQRHANKKYPLRPKLSDTELRNGERQMGNWMNSWCLFNLSCLTHAASPSKSLNFTRLILIFYSRRLQHYIVNRFVSQSAALGRHSAVCFFTVLNWFVCSAIVILLRIHHHIKALLMNNVKNTCTRKIYYKIAA